MINSLKFSIVNTLAQLIPASCREHVQFQFVNKTIMGRKVPARKHHGVRDPIKQAQNRYLQ